MGCGVWPGEKINGRMLMQSGRPVMTVLLRRISHRANQLGTGAGLPDIAQHILGLQAITVVVNQQQVITAGGESCILNTLALTEVLDHFRLLPLVQCIIYMHNHSNLKLVSSFDFDINLSSSKSILILQRPTAWPRGPTSCPLTSSDTESDVNNSEFF